MSTTEQASAGTGPDLHDRIYDSVREAYPSAEDRIDGHVSGELRVELQQAAKDAGVFAPYVAREFGGHGRHSYNALDQAAEREALGARLEELGIVQTMAAAWVIDFEASRGLQRCAARRGVSTAAPVARYLSGVRPFYGSPSEAHRWSLALGAERYRTREREQR